MRSTARIVSTDARIGTGCPATGVVMRQDWPAGWYPAHPEDTVADGQWLGCALGPGHEGQHHDPFDGAWWEEVSP